VALPIPQSIVEYAAAGALKRQSGVFWLPQLLSAVKRTGVFELQLEGLMEGPSVTRRLLVGVLAVAMLLLSGTMAWAVANDLGSAETVPVGVRLIPAAGSPIDISGMTADQLRSLIATSVSDSLLKPVYVNYGKRQFVLKVREGGLVKVDVAAMIADAFRVRQESTLVARVIQSVSGATQTIDVRPRYSVDMTRTRVWVGVVAKSIDKKPSDAVRQVVGNRLVIKASSTGAAVNRKSATELIRRKILNTTVATKVVVLPVTVLRPTVNESSFGKTIVVDKSERKLYLYNGAKVQKTYRVAVGQPQYPTPLGQFKIVEKRYRPTWTNPGSAWATGMPAYIAPGPGNPLGTRAMNLSASGIRIHGTNKVGSIGTAASHGCIRMLMHDVEQLYDLVPVGTTVYVVL
jgi:lipoprotein-anchoring transpeptidase ErfK/SrfK